MRPGPAGRRCAALAVVGLVTLTACAPGSAGPGGDQGPGAGSTRASRVVIGVWGETKVLAPKLGEGGGTFQNDFSLLINSPLAIFDPQGKLHPRLADDLPSLDRGTWTVHPDGTMDTTWRLRPNAVWHDGGPVRARDFAFAIRIYKDPEIARSGSEPERSIDRIDVVDDRTFTIRWNQPYPRADRMIPRQLDGLPSHILEPLYEAQGAAFQGATFWTSEEYVGNGPYRLVQWDKGFRLVYRAFDRYFLGRPQIEEVVMIMTPDANTIVAYLLSGTVDLTVDTTLNQEMRQAVQREWDRSGDGQVHITPTFMRAVEFQFHPDRIGQPALLDPRVRRAIVHALERETLAEVVSGGTSPVADVVMHPSDPLFPRVQQAITRYPYDERRALALLQEAGWTRNSSGVLVNAAGQPFALAAGQQFFLEIWTTQMADNLTELALIASYLHRIGIEVKEFSIPQTQNRERGFRESFPGLTITGHTIDVPWAMDKTSDRCPLPPAFSGGNRGCWSNPEYDHFFRIATTTFNRNEQADAVVEMFRVLTDDLGYFGMSYHMDNTPVRKGLVGPGPRWPAQAGNTWNIHEWRWA